MLKMTNDEIISFSMKEILLFKGHIANEIECILLPNLESDYDFDQFSDLEKIAFKNKLKIMCKTWEE